MKITVLGTPATKGSMKCIGARGGRGHQLVEDHKSTAPWRAKVKQAGEQAVAKLGSLDGPLAIDLTVTIARPASVKPEARPWPITRNTGDVDKYARLIFDALDDAGLYGDDSQIVTCTTSKCYPDTPGALDRLDRPGVVIRIEQIQ